MKRIHRWTGTNFRKGFNSSRCYVTKNLLCDVLTYHATYLGIYSLKQSSIFNEESPGEEISAEITNITEIPLFLHW